MNDIVNTKHREKMEALESYILLNGGEVIDSEANVKHFFAEGTYTRELFIPKGTVLTGKIHLQSCINIISKGKIVAITDDGKHEITAPYTFISGPLVKKGGYAIEDTIWINVFPWDGEENPELVTEALTVTTYKELDKLEQLIDESGVIQ